jgi:hypothetical protein
VSIVHVRNEQNDESIIKRLNNIKDYITSQKAKGYIAYPYITLDCSDIVVFWFSSSFQEVMKTIYQLCTWARFAVSDMFTIYSYSSQFDSSNPSYSETELFQRWKNAEPFLDCLQVYLRSTSVANVNSKYLKMQSVLKDNNVMHEYFYLAGQDDAVISIRKIPIEVLVQIFSEKELLGTISADNNNVSAHTNIAFPYNSIADDIDHTDEISGQKMLKNDMAYNLLTRIQRKISLKVASEKTSLLKNATWLPPYFELFNEFCNTEVSATSHDIYMQVLFCQYRFVELIENMLDEDSYSAEYDDRSNIIRQFLHGWSQLSFHAMHSEFQLTQSFDINRLYLFPAKLCLFYSAFMQLIAISLQEQSFPFKAEHIMDSCAFFITPVVDSDATFTAIYQNKKQHVKLVLGEVPADLLYAPQYLLPVLVHETAHYSGKDIRSRKERYKLLWTSFYYEYAQMLLEPWIRILGINENDTESILKSMYPPPYENDSHNYASVDTIELIESHLLRDIFGLEDNLLNELQIRNLENLFLSKVLSHFNTGTNFSLIKAFPNGIVPSTKVKWNHQTIVNLLITNKELMLSLYKECFSDIVMLYVLQMDACEYLECSLFIHRIRNKAELNRQLEKQENLERFYAIIRYCSDPEHKENHQIDCLTDCYRKFEKLDDQYPNKVLLKCLADYLLVRLKSNEDRLPDRFQNSLNDYLTKCRKAMDNIPEDSFTAYRDIYKDFRSLQGREPVINPISTYIKCSYVTHDFITIVQDFLRENIKETPCNYPLGFTD